MKLDISNIGTIFVNDKTSIMSNLSNITVPQELTDSHLIAINYLMARIPKLCIGGSIGLLLHGIPIPGKDYSNCDLDLISPELLDFRYLAKLDSDFYVKCKVNDEEFVSGRDFQQSFMLLGVKCEVTVMDVSYKNYTTPLYQIVRIESVIDILKHKIKYALDKSLDQSKKHQRDLISMGLFDSFDFINYSELKRKY